MMDGTEAMIAAAIGAAEDIRDPLEGLVERTATDPGAPFAPDALARLALLKKDRKDAQRLLKLAANDCPPSFVESTAAIAELIFLK